LETAKIEWGTKSPKQMRSITSLSYKISHKYHTEYESKGGDCLPQAILKSATRGGGKEETRWKNDRDKHTTGLVVPKK
jgi:hypothetical protein